MNWPMVQFNELYAAPSRNGIYKSKEFHGSGVKIVNMGELFGYDVISNQEMKRLSMTEAEMLKSGLQEGDLLFGRRSLVESGAGKCSLVEGLSEPTTFESSIIRVRVDQEKIRPRFIFYWLKSHQGRGNIKAIVTGTNVKGIKGSSLSKIYVAKPPVDVQDKMVAIIRVYDDLIYNNQRRIELLEQATHLLYKEWFVHLRFPGHEHVKIVDGVPEKWKEGTVNDLGEIITGKTPSTKVSSNYGGKIPFVKTPDMHQQSIVVSTEQTLTEQGAKSQQNKFLPEWSILVSCIGTVGVTSFAGKACQTNQQINAVVPHDNAYRYYSFFALGSLKPRLEAMGGGATMANVNKTKFSSMPIILPEKGVVKVFCDYVNPMFEQIRNLIYYNQKLREARDLLLPKLMSGEITV